MSAHETHSSTTPDDHTGTPSPGARRARLFAPSTSWPELQHVTRLLRTETVGGAALMVAALLGILWANSPWREAYHALRELHVGPAALHLDLSIGHWASDGLLALFFFVVGLELKREFLVGDLTSPAKAALPVAAAVCGVLAPAALYAVTVTALGGSGEQLRGWAIPTATDIAFALAVLAVIGSHLPSALRSFLLTLAVVDDLIAITIIAVFYTSQLQVLPLVLAVIPLALFGLLAQRRVVRVWLLLPLALLTWALVHASGIHATVAGVLLGLTVPVRPQRPSAVSPRRTMAPDTDVAHRLEHRLRPLSAGVAVPLFAFFACGVTVVDQGIGQTLRDPVAIAVVVGLVAGKTLGILGGTWLFATFTKAELDDDLAWTDILGLALLAGIGFTVSLLVGELAFGAGTDTEDHVKLAILVGSLLAAALAAVVLSLRSKVYQRIEAEQSRDADRDGVPDRFTAPGTDGSTLPGASVAPPPGAASGDAPRHTSGP